MQEKISGKDIVNEFSDTREKLNKIVLNRANNVVKRFFSLDSQTYREETLDSKTKEMLGLVSSLVLRCDDCIKYHIIQCFNNKLTTSQIMEVLSVGLIVGGSIVIPHLRRAVEFWVELEEKRFDDLYNKIFEKIKLESEEIDDLNKKRKEIL